MIYLPSPYYIHVGYPNRYATDLKQYHYIKSIESHTWRFYSGIELDKDEPSCIEFVGKTD